MKIIIDWQDISNTAKLLNVEPCAMQAVYEVESNGEAMLPSGKPKILFEGHVFWRELKRAGLNPALIAENHPSLVYPKWTKKHYKGGEAEYQRLELAKDIHPDAAYRSASWGAFQLMGFNHKLCGFSTISDFVAAMKLGAGSQLLAFAAFIRNNGLDGALRAQNWALFAKGYNGPGYAVNQYDQKLARAYAACYQKK